MSGSFRIRPDSPHPFRSRDKRARIGSIEQEQVPRILHKDKDDPLVEARPSSSTRYVEMLLNLDKIPYLYNVLAGTFTWLLLAGYIALPSTFTSLRNSNTLADGAGAAGRVIQKAVQNLPLLGVSAACCGIGASGMGWLMWKWQDNFVWLVNRIILPGLLNSAAGLMTTIINIYAVRSGFWSNTAIITTAVTASCTTLLLVLYLVYETWLLARVKKDHERTMEIQEVS